MSDGPTTGIANPDRPGHWLVPPWPTGASFSDVVRHFLRFTLWRTTSTAHLLAYFEGYQAALESAPADELTYAFYRRWRADLCDCIARCVRIYRDERAAELPPTKRTISTLPAAARATHYLPAQQERAS
jgi:hypothetical protein